MSQRRKSWSGRDVQTPAGQLARALEMALLAGMPKRNKSQEELICTKRHTSNWDTRVKCRSCGMHKSTILRQKGHPLRRHRTRDRSLPQRRQCTEHLRWKQPRRRSRVYPELKLQCMPKENKRPHSWLRWNQHWHRCRRRSRLTSNPTLYRCKRTSRHCGTRLRKLETASPWQPRLPRPVPTWTEKKQTHQRSERSTEEP